MISFPQAPQHIYRHLTLEICLFLNKPTGHCMRQPRGIKSSASLYFWVCFTRCIRPCKIWLARQFELMDWWRVITNHDWVKEDILYACQDWEGLVALTVIVFYDSDSVRQCVTVYDNVRRSGWGGLIKHSGRTMPRVSPCHLPPWTELQSKFGQFSFLQ